MRGPKTNDDNFTSSKPKDLGKVMGRIFHYSNRYIVVVLIAFACAIAATILMLLGPSKLSEMTDLITDGIATGIDINAIIKIGTILIIFYALSWIFNVIQGYIIATITQQISYSMRKDFSSKINRIPMSYFNRVSTGDILSRVTNDVDRKSTR